ncbi:MAG: LysR family transcriptional regulator [Halofilum sp. (in: g-proteobacteria)]|nr:LysR family transcriptional regulator [Halofilum sp. (in: g-proteobacteria)]
MNEQNMPWDDLRTVLAIARTGSLAGAARTLGVNHATVFRRLGAIEARLGVKLFERTRGGYTPTSAGEDVADAAGRIDAEVAGVERRVVGRDRLPAGSLRVTTTDTLLTGLLSPVLADFRRQYPEIVLEIVVSNTQLNLSKRDADVAVRPTSSPAESLVGRRVGTIAQAAYMPDAANRDPEDPGEIDWVGPDETLWYRQLEDWMRRAGHDERCGYRVDSLAGMHAAVRAGAGAAVLPCYLGDADPALARIGGPIEELAIDLWLLTHPDLRDVARIRAFTAFVGDAIRERRAMLAGD